MKLVSLALLAMTACAQLEEQVGYYGQRKMTEGEVRLKRVHKASEANPLTVVYYNLQGR